MTLVQHFTFVVIVQKCYSEMNLWSCSSPNNLNFLAACTEGQGANSQKKNINKALHTKGNHCCTWSWRPATPKLHYKHLTNNLQTKSLVWTASPIMVFRGIENRCEGKTAELWLKVSWRVPNRWKRMEKPLPVPGNENCGSVITSGKNFDCSAIVFQWIHPKWAAVHRYREKKERKK